MPVTGWNPLGLNSAGLPVPHQGTTRAWTRMAQVGASEFGHWQAFGFRSPVGSAGTRRACTLVVQGPARPARERFDLPGQNRKGFVEGKSADLAGRRIIKRIVRFQSSSV